MTTDLDTSAPPSGQVEDAVRAELVELGALDLPLGRNALKYARQIDEGSDVRYAAHRVEECLCSLGLTLIPAGPTLPALGDLMRRRIHAIRTVLEARHRPDADPTGVASDQLGGEA